MYITFSEPRRETAPAVLRVEILSTGTARNSARTVSASSPEAVNSHTAEGEIGPHILEWDDALHLHLLEG